MSDYTDLIRKLRSGQIDANEYRNSIADALEAQAKQIEKMGGQLSQRMTHDLVRAERAEARVAELEGALKDIAGDLEYDPSPSNGLDCAIKARAALAADAGKEKP